MFEQLVADFLTKYLGSFVEGVDRRNLQVAVWQGEVILTHLRVKRRTLDEFKLPLFVKGGYLGQLSLMIPWNNLQNEAIIVILEDLHVRISPYGDHSEAEEETESLPTSKTLKEKEAEIQAFEAGRELPKLEGEAANPGSFFGALLTKIVDNIQVQINNVHIRYESDITDKLHPQLSFGITLEHLDIVSTDPNFSPSFLHVSHSIIYKLLSLKNFAVYLNAKDPPLCCESDNDMVTKMRNMVYRTDNSRTNVNYVIRPVRLTVKAIVNKNKPSKECPKITSDLLFEELAISLSEDQYHDIIPLIAYFDFIAKRYRFRDIRPTVSPKENPKAWWIYVVKAQSRMKQKKKLGWSEESIQKRRMERLLYIRLFKKKLKHQLIEKKDILDLSELEAKFPNFEIAFLRKKARQALETSGYLGHLEFMPKVKHYAWNTLSKVANWINIPLPTANQQQEPVQKDPTIVNSDEDTIHFTEADEEKLLAVLGNDFKFPKDAIFLRASIQMKRGFFQLCTRNGNEIGKFHFLNFNFDGLFQPENFLVNLRIQKAEIFDSSTPNTRFPVLLSPFISPKDTIRNFFEFQIAYKPQDVAADFSVKARSQPVNVIANIQWINRVIQFFERVDIAPERVQHQVDYLKAKYSEQMAFALESRKTLHLDIKLQPPQIVIPENIKDDRSPVVIANLGKLCIHTIPDEDKTKEERDLPFYTILLRLSSVSLLAAPSLMSTPSFVVDNFHVKVLLDISLAPTSTSAPKIRLFGNLPAINLSIAPDLIKYIRLVAFSFMRDKLESQSNELQLSKPSSVPPSSHLPTHTQSLLRESRNQQTEEKFSTFLHCTFTVSSVKIKLENEKGDALLSSTINNIKLFGVDRKLHSRIEISLQSFNVEDKVQQRNFKLESAPLLAETQVNSQHPYINLIFHINKTLGIASHQIVFLSFESLRASLHQLTAVELIRFAGSLTYSEQERAVAYTPKSNRSIPPANVEQHVDRPSPIFTLSASCSIKSLEISLAKEQTEVCILLCEFSKLLYEQKDKLVHINGSLGKISAKDLIGTLPDIVSIGDEAVLSFSITSQISSISQFPESPTNLHAEINCVRFVYSDHFICEIQRYFNDLKETQELINSTTTSAFNQFSGNTVKYNLKINHPQLVIPSDKSESILLLDFGNIFLSNEFGFHSSQHPNLRCESIFIAIKDLHINSHIVKSAQEVGCNYAAERYLLEESSISLEVRRVLEGNDIPENIIIEIPKFNFLINEDQYMLLVDLYLLFIHEKPQLTPHKIAQLQRQKFEAKPHQLQPISLIEQTVAISIGMVSIHFLGASKFPHAADESKKKELKFHSFFNLKDNSEVKLSELHSGNTVQLKFSGHNIKPKHNIPTFPDLFFIVSTINGNLKTQLYKSETVFNTSSPEWKEFTLPVKDLRNNEPITIEVYEFNIASNITDPNALLGGFEANLVKLCSEKKFELQVTSNRNTTQTNGYIGVVSVEVGILQAKKKHVSFVTEKNSNKRVDQPNVSMPDDVSDCFAELICKNMNIKICKSKNDSFFVDSYADHMSLKDRRPHEAIEDIVQLQGTVLQLLQTPFAGQQIVFKSDQSLVSVVPDLLFPFKDFIFMGLYRLMDEGVNIDAFVYFPAVKATLFEDPKSKKSNQITATTKLRINYRYRVKGIIQQVVVSTADLRLSHLCGDHDSTVLFPINNTVNYIWDLKSGSFTTRLHEPLNLMLSYQDIQVLLGVFKSLSSVELTFAPGVIVQPVQTEVNVSGSINVALSHEHGDIPPLVRILIDYGFNGIYPKHASSDVSINGSYFHLQKACWEPLIEDWKAQFMYETTKKGNAILKFESNMLLHINMTAALIDTLALWLKDFERGSCEEYRAISIRNFTNTNIRYSLSNMINEKILPAGRVATVGSALGAVTVYKQLDLLPDSRLSIVYEDVKVANLPINKQGVAVVDVPATSMHPNPQRLIYEVVCDTGKRILTVRSSIVLKNNTHLPLQIRVEVPKSSQVQELHDLRNIQPGGEDSIPCELIEKGRIHFRPITETEAVPNCESYNGQIQIYQYSDLPAGHQETVLWSSGIEVDTLKPETFYLSLPTVSCDQQFVFLIRVKEEIMPSDVTIKLHTITISSPLIVENLLAFPLKMRIRSYSSSLEQVIDKGQKIPLCCASLHYAINVMIQLPGFEWSNELDVNTIDKSPYHDELKFKLRDALEKQLKIYVHKHRKEGALHIVFYCKYWIYNKTAFNILLYHNFDELAAGQASVRARDLKTYNPKDWSFVTSALNNADPLQFSKNKLSKQVHLQLENLSVAKVKLDMNVVQQGELEFIDVANKMKFCFGVSVQMGTERFKRTKFITITPRFILMNKTGSVIYYKQTGTDQIYPIDNEEITAVNWKDGFSQSISISLDASGKWTWSGGLSYSKLETSYIKLTKVTDYKEYFIRIDIEERNSTIVACLHEKTNEFSPYRIENLTKQTLTFWQNNNIKLTHIVESGKYVHYVFDEPSKKHKIVVSPPNLKNVVRCNVDKVKVHAKLDGIIIRTVTDGPTRVLQVIDTVEYDTGAIAPINDKTEKKKTTLSLQLKGIGVSIVDHTPKELLFVSLANIFIEVENSKSTTTVQLVLDDLQIDNQLPVTPFPVLLKRTTDTTASVKDTDKAPMIRLSLVKSNEYSSIDYIKYFSVLINELDLNADANVVNALISMINLAKEKLGKAMTPNESVEAQTRDLLFRHPVLQTRMMYFELLHINSVKVNVSFVNGRHILVDEEEKHLEQMLGGLRIPKIDRAPIKLNALLLENPFVSSSGLLNRLASHYKWEVIKKSYRVLGSFDIIGNPVNSLSALGSGFKDFFYEPAKGIAYGPKEFMRGLRRGSKSLMKKSIYALFNPIAGVSEQLSDALATVTMDKHFVNKRAMVNVEEPSDFKDGLSKGSSVLGHGFADGVTGMVKLPQKQQKLYGTRGLFKGIGLGILGVGLKPASGFVDFAAKTAKGITNQMIHKPFDRIRFPRHFNDDQVLVPYNAEKSYRQYLISSLHGGKYSHEQISFHSLLSDARTLVIVTNNHVFTFKCPPKDDTLYLKWKINYKQCYRLLKVEDDQVLLTKKGKDYLLNTATSYQEEVYQAIHNKWTMWHKLHI